jgi:hypothetical protein
VKKRDLSLLTIIFLLTGCNHYYYVQPVHNVPMLKEKNDFRVSGTYEIDYEPYCIELQAAYAVTGKIGIIADFMAAKGGTISDLENWGKGTYFDAGVGFFNPVKQHGIFEIYSGMGSSSQHHNYISYDNPLGETFSGTSDLAFTKIFLQPSIGLSYEHFEVVASTRINMLNYNRVINNVNQQLEQDEYEELISLNTKKSYLFIEPALTVRAGWENLKIQLQAATASYLNNREYPFEQNHISIGLILGFPLKVRERVNKSYYRAD